MNVEWLASEVAIVPAGTRVGEHETDHEAVVIGDPSNMAVIEGDPVMFLGRLIDAITKTAPRCTSLSEDGRRCHGDVGHPGTHWAGASRVWSDPYSVPRGFDG